MKITRRQLRRLIREVLGDNDLSADEADDLRRLTDKAVNDALSDDPAYPIGHLEEMSDPELINTANIEGVEDYIVLDAEGGLANRDEVIAAIREIGTGVHPGPDTTEYSVTPNAEVEAENMLSDAMLMGDTAAIEQAFKRLSSLGYSYDDLVAVGGKDAEDFLRTKTQRAASEQGPWSSDVEKEFKEFIASDPGEVIDFPRRN